MGLLRTLLALDVLLTHVGSPIIFFGGQIDVQLFYVISGFLISYILVERKSYASIGNFYLNRYLRLYPIYLVVASFTLFVIVLASFGLVPDCSFFEFPKNAPFVANALLIFTNITLFFQDWTMFFAVENNQLLFSADFAKSQVVLYRSLLVPQAWTLGVELSFYLIAPFVITRKRVLIFFLGVSIAIRMYLIFSGLATRVPWSFRFFPSELTFFLLGALSHQILLPFYRRLISKEKIGIFANLSTFAIIFTAISFWHIPIAQDIKTLLLFGFFVVLLPLIFLFEFKGEWDKKIGGLSYPIYISHLLVIYLVVAGLEKFGIDNTILKTIFSGLLTILFSILLNRFIGVPIEFFRNRFRAKIKIT